MRSGGLRLGTVLGVRVMVHPSWVLMFVLVVIYLGAVGGPAAGSALPRELRWVAAPLVATLFFGSVLFHELAHAVVARRLGVAIDEVMLFIFGGAARVDQDAPSPRVEALITIAGPLASGALGLGLLGAGVLVGSVEGGAVTALVAEVVIWLGAINLILAVFNLLPGFPMDGGRLLRALVWSRNGDYVRATGMATMVARLLAYMLIGLGFFVALTDSRMVVLGVWTAFVGWFVYQAADATYRRVTLARMVEGVVVADVMERDVGAVSPNLTLDTFVDQALLARRAAMYPVTQDGDLVGTIDLRQIRRVKRSDWQTTRVTDVMLRGDAVRPLTEPQPALDAIGRFQESDVPAIPVVAQGDRRRLLGIVTRDGLVRALRAREALRSH